MIMRYIKRFPYAFKGIWTGLRTDFSYRWQAIGVGLFLAGFIYVMQPLSQTEILFLGLGYVLVLITELQNSSFEAALDRLHPELHDDIGKSKDMAAGAVLTAGFFLLFVVFVILFF